MTIEVGNATDAALGSTPGAGVGLRNTRTRLAACYGGRARLETRVTEPGRFTATVTVPRSIGRKADAALAGERR
jgi:sensor histidine kinase YesM